MIERCLRIAVILLTALAVLLADTQPSSCAQSTGKAMVFAWDGTVPAFVHRLLREDKLPNLAKLIEGGALADDVTPGFPSKTAPGFASLITGAPPRITGISGNRVPRAPRDQHTILESLAGFSEAPLRAEPIWSAAERGGKNVIVSHIPAFGGEQSEKAVRFAGYEVIAGRDGIVTKRAIQAEHSVAVGRFTGNDAEAIEITFIIGESKFFGLLIDDPNDAQAGYDTITLARSRSGKELIAKLKPASASAVGEFFWSEPVAVKTGGNQDARVYFRLFDLKPDGSDFFMYYTRPMRDLPMPAGGSRSERDGANIHRQRGELSLPARRLGPHFAERRFGGSRSSLSGDRYLCATPVDGDQSLGAGKSTMGYLSGLYPVSRRSGARVARLSRLDSIDLPARRCRALAAIFRKSLRKRRRASRFSIVEASGRRIFRAHLGSRHARHEQACRA